MTQIHAEITADQGRIVLLAGGLGLSPDTDAEVALAAKQLQTLTPLFSKSDPPGAMTVPATWPAVVQLSATFGDDLVVCPGLQAWIGDQVAVRSNPGPLNYTAPEGLTPYPWQVEGAAMIAATGKALITDEPGTGKTITAILGLVEHNARGRHGWTGTPGALCACGWAKTSQVHGIHEDHRRHVRAAVTDEGFGSAGPCIVVCPASVVDHWVAAWQTWAPHLRAVAWRGPQRKGLAGTADVYVTSYDNARSDAGVVRGQTALLDMKAAAVVIDECHLIKNRQAQRSQAVRRLGRKVSQGANGQHGAVVALSGTPITHHPGDLWSSLEAIEHDAWPSRERWVRRYCQTIETDYREEILGLSPYTEAEFRLTLMGQFRRVAKADVLSQLPPKVYSIRTVALPPAWRRAYDDFESQMLAELPGVDGPGDELSVTDTLSVLTHLSSLACAAADVRVEFGPDLDDFDQPKRHVHLDLKALPSGGGWKVDALLEVLEERPGSPVVAFAPSRQLMMLAGAAAQKAGLRVGYIVGGQAAGARTATVNAFQAGALDVICATTGAGGVGLTLTAARTVVFLQRPWSLVESLQAEDRCHRIGSEIHDSIEIVDVVARDTIDTRVRAVLRERAGQLADLVQDPRIVAELLGGAGAVHQPARLQAVAS